VARHARRRTARHAVTDGRDCSDPFQANKDVGLASLPIDQFGLDAVQDAAGATPSISLAGSGEAFYDTGVARDVMAPMLADHPEIDVVFASGVDGTFASIAMSIVSSGDNTRLELGRALEAARVDTAPAV
jgi:ABC-type sugar transport system substrate-binding protein